MLRKIKISLTSNCGFNRIIIILAVLVLLYAPFGAPVAGAAPLQQNHAYQTVAGEGWLDPGTRHQLHIVNALIFAILLGLTTISFFLWYRLRDKVTMLQEANQKLIDQDELIRLATEAAQVGIWDFYPSRGLGFFSDHWYAMFGYEPVSRGIPLSEWRAYVHPDDLAGSEQAFTDYTQSGLGLYESELRIRKADGSWCWVLARGRAIELDEMGMPSRIIGLHLNIQNIKDAQERLVQSEDRFRALFKMAPLPMVNLALDGRITDINNSFSQVIGYTIDEIPTIDYCWKLGFPDEDYRRTVISTWGKTIKAAMGNGLKGEPAEYRVTCKDGAVRDMMVGASVTGNSIIVNFFDITELRRAEEKIISSLREKEVLLKEIHHRVKNNLQLIISLLNLQVEGSENNALKEGFDEAKRRILSMALIHEQLYQSSDYSRIDMAYYLKLLTGELKGTMARQYEDVRLIYDIEPTFLGIDMAIPCGLIVNEIVTNSIKHAFRGGQDTPEISISLHAGEGNDIALHVSDNGIGLPDTIDPKTVKTLGLHLVAVLIEQIHGRYVIHREKGTGWEIFFPAAISR